jgi:hypothetical protein
MRMSGTQLSVSQGGAGGVTTLLDLSDDTEIGEPEKTTAAAAFLGCVSTSAKTDKRLTPDQTQSMIIEPTSKNSDVVRGTDIGKRVGQFGDELESIRAKMQDDQVFQDFVDNAVRGRDSRRASVNAFEEFTTIANQVLEVGDTGVASAISYGRIATLFLLGYEMCSAFIRRHGATLFMGFIGTILNYLIRFLYNIGFFDWLVRHSWGHLTPEGAVYATGLGTGLALGAVAVGVMVVAVWFMTRRRS